MRIRLMSLSLLVLVATLVMAAEQPSVGRGKELFSSTALGTNGNSCASCHAAGAGLEDVKGYDTATLEATVNQCIAKALAGTPLPTGSVDLISIVMYLKSLGLVGTP